MPASSRQGSATPTVSWHPYAAVAAVTSIVVVSPLLHQSQNRWWRITSRACAYEAGTAWGTGVGFMYQSVVEDYFTGYQRFFSRGWTSAYCYPEPRPAFLGSVPTNLNDVLVQNKR